MLTEEEKTTALATLDSVKDLLTKSDTENVEPEEKNPLRKGLDSVLDTMANLVKAKKPSNKDDDYEDMGNGKYKKKGDKSGQMYMKGKDGHYMAAGHSGTNFKKNQAEPDSMFHGYNTGETNSPGATRKNPGNVLAYKSLKDENDIQKGLKDNPEFQEAFEASDLIKSVVTAIENLNKGVDAIAGMIENVNENVCLNGENQAGLTKSLAGIEIEKGKLLKDMHKSLEAFAKAPVGRKSLAPEHVQLLEKAVGQGDQFNHAVPGGNIGGDNENIPKTFATCVAKLNKAMTEGGNPYNVQLTEATGFELNGINGMTPNIKKSLQDPKFNLV